MVSFYAFKLSKFIVIWWWRDRTFKTMYMAFGFSYKTMKFRKCTPYSAMPISRAALIPWILRKEETVNIKTRDTLHSKMYHVSFNININILEIRVSSFGINLYCYL
jgi:hypothetical protein